MNTVMLSRQNYVPILKLLNPPWQTKVRVRPLVNLIGKGDKDCQGKHVTVHSETSFYRILLKCEVFVDQV